VQRKRRERKWPRKSAKRQEEGAEGEKPHTRDRGEGGMGRRTRVIRG
jgi:hypothetical protein